MPLSPPQTPHRTKNAFVYQTLRDAIVRCELRPGERLVIEDLARRLDVSIIPVREALQQLQADALVVAVPHVGATVAPITRESIDDVFTVLEGMETVASRIVAERAEESELSALDGLVADMDAAAESGQYERWADLNSDFHLLIATLPGLPLLRDMTARVLDRWDRIRRYYFNGVLVPRVEQAQREHHEIMSALRARDAAQVEARIRRHNRRAHQAYLSYLEPPPSSRSSAS